MRTHKIPSEKLSLFCILTWRYDLHSLARTIPASAPKVFEPLKFYCTWMFYYTGMSFVLQANKVRNCR